MEFHLINLLLILLIAWVAGALTSRLGYPAILGELAAGIVFGPALLHLVKETPDLAVLAELGVFLLLLYIGMEIDYRDLMRVSWRGVLAAAGSFVAPFALCYGAVVYFGFPARSALVVGLAMGATSLAAQSRILVDMKLLGTRVANILIAGALLLDTIALVVFGILIGVVGETSVPVSQVAALIAKTFLFFGITIYLGIRIFPLLGRLLRKTGLKERTANFTLVLLVALVFAGLAELAGLHAILGAFLAGLFMRGEILARKLSHEVTTMVRDLSLGFLAPLFFVSAGFHMDLMAIVVHWQLLVIVLLLGTAGKILGTAICYLPGRKGWPEALTIGAGMNGHGAVEIIMAEVALELGIIGQDLFSIVVFTTFATTMTVPLFLKTGTRWLRKRNELVRADENRKGILIAGATPVARAMARELSVTEPVWLIDSNINRCRAAEADGLKVFQGNALNENTLNVTNAAGARVFITMTPNPQVNTIARQLARDLFGVPDLLTVPEPEKPAAAGDDEASESEPVLLFPREFKMEEWNLTVARKEVEPVVYDVEEPLDLKTLMVRLLHIQILPLALEREGRRILPALVNEYQEGDRIHGLRRHVKETQKEDPFHQLVKQCPVLDLPGPMEMKTFFQAAAERLAPVLNLPEKKIFDLLVHRERESSTVIVPGLAVPHVVIPGKQKTQLLIARCREGIRFYEEEGIARIAFVIAGTRDERNVHLRILSAIAQLFQDTSFEDTLLTVEEPGKMREVILTTKRQRF